MATVRLEDVKSIIRSLLISTQKNMRVFDLCRDYQQSEGSAIPFHELGFNSTVDFLKSLTDTVIVTQGPSVGGKVTYYIRPMVSQSTKHMEDFVLEQENKSKRKGPKRPHGQVVSSHERSRSSPPLRTTFNKFRSSSTPRGSHHQVVSSRAQENFQLELETVRDCVQGNVRSVQGSRHQELSTRTQDNFQGSQHKPETNRDSSQNVQDSVRGSYHQGIAPRAQDNFQSSQHKPETVRYSSQSVQSVQDSVIGSNHQGIAPHAQDNFQSSQHKTETVRYSSPSVRSVQDSVLGSNHQGIASRAQDNFQSLQHKTETVRYSSQSVQGSNRQGIASRAQDNFQSLQHKTETVRYSSQSVRSVQDSVLGSDHQGIAPRAQDNFQSSQHKPETVRYSSQSVRSVQDSVLGSNRQGIAPRAQDNFQSSQHKTETVRYSSQSVRSVQDSVLGSDHQELSTRAQNNFRGLHYDPDKDEKSAEQKHMQNLLHNLSGSTQQAPALIPTKVFHPSSASNLQADSPVFVPRVGTSGSQRIQHKPPPFPMRKSGVTNDQQQQQQEQKSPVTAVKQQDSATFKPIGTPPGFKCQEKVAEPAFSPVSDYDPACGVHEKVVKKVVNLLKRNPQGIQAIDLLSMYKRCYKSVLDYSGYGFSSVMDMVSALKNHITARRDSDFADFTLLLKNSTMALEYLEQLKDQEDSRMTLIPQKVQDRTKRILEDFRRGLKAHEFVAHYRSYFNEVLNPNMYGYSCLDTFFMSMDKHCLKATFEQGEIVVYPLPATTKQEEPVSRPPQRQFAPVQPSGTLRCGESLPVFQWPKEACVGGVVAMSVEFVQSPLRFYYTFHDQRRRSVIRMMLHMTRHYRNSTVDLSIRKMHKDLMVVVVHENVLHRARILQVYNETTCLVYLVDFGNMFEARREKLYYLRCEYATIPAQAQLGALFNVVPINRRTDWADTDTDTFFCMVNKTEPLSARFMQFNKTKGCASFTIYSSSGHFCVNNEMVRLRVADYYDKKYIQREDLAVTMALASSESRHSQQYTVPGYVQQPYGQYTGVPLTSLASLTPSFDHSVSSTPQPTVISQHSAQTGWYPAGAFTGAPLVASHITPAPKSRRMLTDTYAMDNEVAALTSKIQQLPTHHSHTAESNWYPTGSDPHVSQHNAASSELRDTDDTHNSHPSQVSYYYPQTDSEDDSEQEQQEEGRIFIVADKWGRETLHIVNYQEQPHLLLEEVAGLLNFGSGAALLMVTKGHVTLHDVKLHETELPALFQQINELQLDKYVLDQRVQLLPLRSLGVVLSLIRNPHVDSMRQDLIRHLMLAMGNFNPNDPCWFCQS